MNDVKSLNWLQKNVRRANLNFNIPLSIPFVLKVLAILFDINLHLFEASWTDISRKTEDFSREQNTFTLASKHHLIKNIAIIQGQSKAILISPSMQNFLIYL